MKNTYKPTIWIDFDGVINSYKSGWQGVDVISDSPVRGAFDALREYIQHVYVCIFSTRSSDPRGIEAMKFWFIAHGWPSDDTGNPIDLLFPMQKPPAIVGIDDRVLLFEGTFPSVDTLLAFKPWYQKEEIA
jgi:hypothetical protein